LAGYENLFSAADSNIEGIGTTFDKEFTKAYNILKQMLGVTGEMKENAKETASAYTGQTQGSSKLGLGTLPLKQALGQFSKGQLAMGAAVVGGSTVMSMAPNTMSAVAQRMYADSVAGLSGMKASQVISQSNRLVQGATSAGGPTAAAANLFYQGGYSAGSVSSQNIMASLGGLSAITGGSNEQVASSLAGINGMMFLRLGIRIRDNNGQLLPINQIINSVYNGLYGGRQITQEQAATLLNPGSKGYQTLMMVCGGDQNLFMTIAMGVITRAKKGSALTTKDLGSANQALNVMGVEGNSPIRAQFKYNQSQNNVLASTQAGLVNGYNISLDTVAALNDGFAKMASALSPVTYGLMSLKGALQTFPNAGNMGSTISNIGSTAMGFLGQGINAAILGKVLGIGKFAPGATAVADTAMAGTSLAEKLGAGGLLSKLSGVGKIAGKGLPIIGTLLSALAGYQDRKSNGGKFNWGSVGKSAGAGAATTAAFTAWTGPFDPFLSAGAGLLAGGADAIGQLFSGGGTGGGQSADIAGQGSANSTQGFQTPVPKGTPVTSPYGPRAGGRGVKAGFHPGVDYGVVVGTPIKAAATGIVTETGNGGGWGNYVLISHGSYSTRYAHLSKINVHKGQQVNQGDVIGLSGGAKGAPGSGNSTGPHLHFELIQGAGKTGKTVNPQGFFGRVGGFFSNLLKSGLNMAKKAVGWFTGSNSSGPSTSFYNAQSHQSYKTMSDLNSASLSQLLNGDTSTYRPVGYSELHKYLASNNNRSMFVNHNPGALVDSHKDLVGGDVSGTMYGGSRKALIELLAKTGFKGKALDTAFAVALAESGGNPRDYNGSGRDKSYGLFQINMNNNDPASPNMGRNRLKQFHIKNNNALFNATTNAKAAYEVSNKGTWWKDWATYNNGSFLRYIDDAHAAEQQAGLHGGGPINQITGGAAHVLPTQTHGKVAHQVNVTMHVNIAQSSTHEAEQMFRTFQRRVQAAIESHELRVY